MHRPLILVAALLVASPASAQVTTTTCTDAKGEVTIAFDTAAASEGVIKEVRMQLTGDFGISTNPADPDYSGEFVSSNFRTTSQLNLELSTKDTGTPVLALRIGEVSEGQAQSIVGGVLGVGGGGVWLVTCDNW